MKKLVVLFIVIAAVFGTAHAQTNAHVKKTTPHETVQSEKALCPVTGEEADPDISYAYNGKTYYFCCENCVAKFKDHPAKYIKAAAVKKYDACMDHAGMKAEKQDAHEADKAALKSNATHAKDAIASGAVINTGKDLSAQITNDTCPVMGEKVDAKVTTVTYRNKVYGFCCKGCVAKFAADPEKYLKN